MMLVNPLLSLLMFLHLILHHLQDSMKLLFNFFESLKIVLCSWPTSRSSILSVICSISGFFGLSPILDFSRWISLKRSIQIILHHIFEWFSYLSKTRDRQKLASCFSGLFTWTEMFAITPAPLRTIMNILSEKINLFPNTQWYTKENNSG